MGLALNKTSLCNHGDYNDHQFTTDFKADLEMPNFATNFEFLIDFARASWRAFPINFVIDFGLTIAFKLRIPGVVLTVTSFVSLFLVREDPP